MKKSVTLVLLLVSAAISLHVSNVEHEANTFPTGKVNLKADNGKYLSRCYKCGVATNDNPVTA